MSFLYNIGLCCSLLSVWAVIQLVVMGVVYHFESVLLIEDAHAHEYEDYDDFIKKTKSNYSWIATNCWICAGMYAVTLLLSVFCYKSGKARMILEEKKNSDENRFCDRIGIKRPETKPVQKKKNQKLKKKQAAGDRQSSTTSL